MSYAASNLTSGFIDLATYDEQEKYTYGGAESIAYFVREVRKSTWFTQVPVVLSKSSGQAGFGQQWSVSVSRAGDYLLHTWLRVVLPEVKASANNTGSTSGTLTTQVSVLRWSRNLMHNLIQECSITFNDLVAARFDNFHLDFWAAFTVPAGKRNGYNAMIGNVNQLINPVAANPLVLIGAGVQQTGSSLINYGPQVLPSQVLNLPLPFFFTRDSGVALPTAALPYNEMRINFSFRNWNDLLIKDTYYPTATPANNALLQPALATSTGMPISGAAPVLVPNNGVWVSAPAQIADLSSNEPSIGNNTQVWANYAIVSNEERKKMACAPRDILIEQVQTAPLQSLNNATSVPNTGVITQLPSGNPLNPQFDIRFSHAVKVLFWAARNKANTSAWSNYTSDPQCPLGPHQSGNIGVQFGNALFGVVDFSAGSDPIDNTSLVYENTQRLQNMGSDYFSLVNPWYHSPVIPLETGYHSYSYSLDYTNIDPMGSTNYGKLTNVSILPAQSQSLLASSYLTVNGGVASANAGKFDFITTCVNNNIIRISGGALGFPVL
jgi:Major capsid protein N-terminus/Large eukaryotic DNA virus major capsid protein